MPEGIGNPIFILAGLTAVSAIIFAIGLRLRSAHVVRGRIAGAVLAILAVVPLFGGALALVLRHQVDQPRMAHSATIAEPKG
jgi:hypothetical protein